MFSEILKIVPKIDEKDLKKMQGTLQARFTKISKGFGKGLMSVLKGGGIAGIAIGLIDKLLNPLKEVQEAIDRTLNSSDDLATNAAQFNTSAGKLFKLVTLAKATGLDQDGLFTLLTKFQTAVAEAKADPNNPISSAVKNYIDTEDISEAFFGFITQLQKMDKNSQVLIQKQVFGEKQILKMADFLQQDFTKLSKITGIDKVSSDKVGGSIEKLGALSDLKGALAARREFNDIRAKAGVINEGMIRNMDKSERLALDRENAKIKSYNDLAALSQTAEKIFTLVDQGVGLLGSLIGKLTPFIDKVTNAIDRLMKSPAVRGIKGLFGGKDD